MQDVLKRARALLADYSHLMKLAGYSEEIHEDGDIYEKVYKNAETGEIVDVTRGGKRMLDTDEEWANLAFRATCNLSSESREVLVNLVRSDLENDRKKNHGQQESR